MPFGEYKSIRCDNPDCKKWFRPVTSWQRHCSKRCSNHAVYLRTVLLKRLETALKNGSIAKLEENPDKIPVLERRLEKGLEKLERIKKLAKPEWADRVARLEARMGSRWNQVKIAMGARDAEGKERVRADLERRKAEIKAAEEKLAALKDEYEVKKQEG